jgi:hypothetical protein
MFCRPLRAEAVVVVLEMANVCEKNGGLLPRAIRTRKHEINTEKRGQGTTG